MNNLKIVASVIASLLGTSIVIADDVKATDTKTADVAKQKKQTVMLGNEVSQYNNAIAENPAKAKKDDSRTAEEIITDHIDSYLSSHTNANGTKYVSGIAELSFDPSDSNYGDSLQLKYIEAVANAQTAFITSINQEITDEVSSQTISNQGTQAYKIANEKPLAGSEEATKAKKYALDDAEIDKKLKAQGLNPDDYESPKEKRQLLANVELTTKTMTKAFGDIIGLIPVKTFFEQKDGKGSIGVVLRYSPKIRTLFEAIKRGETPMIEGKGGKSASEFFVDKSGYDLFPEFGIRLGFDKNNKPFILAYGQGTYTGPKVPGQSGASFAYQQASLMAKRNIAQAMAGTISTSSLMTMAQKAAVTLVKNEKSGAEKQETTNEISKQLKTSMQSQAKADIKGLTQVKRWSYQIPGTTNKIYGVVYEWTPALAQDANDVINYDYDTAKNKYAPKKSVTSSSAEESNNARVSRQSKDNPYENEW